MPGLFKHPYRLSSFWMGPTLVTCGCSCKFKGFTERKRRRAHLTPERGLAANPFSRVRRHLAKLSRSCERLSLRRVSGAGIPFQRGACEWLRRQADATSDGRAEEHTWRRRCLGSLASSAN